MLICCLCYCLPYISVISRFFFFTDPPTTEIYTLSLHDALPISACASARSPSRWRSSRSAKARGSSTISTCSRSEEHTSELQSLRHLVCRLLLEKKKKKTIKDNNEHSDTERNDATFTAARAAPAI